MQLPIPSIAGEPLTEEQGQYLDGFFAGLRTRGFTFEGPAFSPVLETPGGNTRLDDLIFEERVKRETHPLDAFERLVDYSIGNRPPDKEDLFRFKWHGLFFLTPIKDAYMARLRIPGGFLKSFQLRELARIAEELTSGYTQITTRANLQMRLIQPKDASAFLHRIQGIGLHTRGSGADNIRNLTANPTAGIDPQELIDVRPLIESLAQIIVNDRAFYDLPRKFNVAYDGGGLIGTVEDTNDVGARAYEVDGAVKFRIALRGATGHKAFARDAGIAVAPEELNRVVAGFIKAYIELGNRGDRKKARLKHLLEKMSIEDFVAAAEKRAGVPFQRSSIDLAAIKFPSQDLAHSHVGVFPQKQPGLFYVGAAIPVGQITSRQMRRLAEISELYGTGEVRLTVWQNLIIPNIPEAFVETVKKALVKMGLHHKQSHVSSGIIACTGSRYCKFAASDTKGHVIELSHYLEKRVKLDQPVNIHFTGCAHSCAQHYMGDIGLLGAKVKFGGESVEGYHVFVGGGFGRHQAVGRQLYTGVTAAEIPVTIERILKGYLAHRQNGETFREFTERHDLRVLQEYCSETTA